MERTLKTIIAALDRKNTEAKISEIDINEEQKQVSVSYRRSNAKTKVYSLIDVLLIKDTILATTMLVDGYVLVPLGDNYVVVSPKGQTYQLDQHNCTCPDFVVARGNQSRCKHLIFRDWHIQYQQRCLKAKEQIER